MSDIVSTNIMVIEIKCHSLCNVFLFIFLFLTFNFFFSKHETAEGGNQAIRIKRFTESVFLPVRKLGGVGANKGKVQQKIDSYLHAISICTA